MSRRSHKKHIINRSGEQELFEPRKLCDSVLKVGASPELADQVCAIVSDSIDSGISTDTIFKTTRDYLNKFDPGIAAVYALERGLSALGPSGFLFEQYVGEILNQLDYNVRTNVYMDGEGVKHEIDVYAEKGNVVYIVEAKYRNDFKTKTHINQVMYADARLGDIRRQARANGDTREYYMWVVTNTEFTDAAINYVYHRDVQLIGWSFPKYINLMKIVHEKKFYPVTVLPSITQKALKAFSANKKVLVSQLARYSINDFMEHYKLSHTLSKKLHNEIHHLYSD